MAFPPNGPYANRNDPSNTSEYGAISSLLPFKKSISNTSWIFWEISMNQKAGSSTETVPYDFQMWKIIAASSAGTMIEWYSVSIEFQGREEVR
jgi:hypothetical protein